MLALIIVFEFSEIDAEEGAANIILGIPFVGDAYHP